MKYLFIDFDGVLHGEEYNTDYFHHSKEFCERLYPYKHKFKIVVSSSWRATYEFDILVEAFEKSLQDNVIGHTPISNNGFLNGGRYLEIKQYCKKNFIEDSKWIAVDDMERLFPNNCKNLILTNSAIGLTPDNLNLIEKFIKE